MNTREKFEEMLFNYGLFPDQAKEIMELAMPICDNTVDGYKFTWDSPADEYPKELYPIVFGTTIKKVALNWINENAPMAWYKSAFE